MAMPTTWGGRPSVGPRIYKTAAPAKKKATPKAPASGLAGYYDAASKIAGQETNATVAAIQQQQASERAAAAEQARQIRAGALGTAQFLAPLGDKTLADYQAAQAAQGAFAQGYTGQLRDTSTQQAQASQQQLGSVPGNTQQIQSNGDSLANLLYGVSGAIPQNVLAANGLAATAAARALPGSALSYGEAQALGQIQAGNKSAQALNNDIIAARAKQGALSRSIFGTLEGADYHQQSLANTRAANEAIAAHRVQQEQQAAQNAAALAGYRTDYLGLTGQRIAQQGAYQSGMLGERSRSNDIADYRAHHPSAGVGPNGAKVYSTSRGLVTFDANGKPHLAFPAGSSSRSATAGLKITNSLVKNVASSIASWKVGKPGSPSQATVPPLDYDAALTQALALGPSTKAWATKAKQLVNATYGDPVTITRQNAIKTKAQGLSAAEQLKAVIEANAAGQFPYPIHFAIDAIARAYGLPLAALEPVAAELTQGNG